MNPTENDELVVALRAAIVAGMEEGFAEADKAAKTFAVVMIAITAFVLLALDDWCSRDLAQTWEHAAHQADDECGQKLSVAYGLVSRHATDDDSGNAAVSEADVDPAVRDDAALDEAIEGCTTADGLLVFNLFSCAESVRVCDEDHDAIELPTFP